MLHSIPRTGGRIPLTLAASLAAVSPAFAANWTAGNSDYGTTTNWDTAAVPIADEDAYINNGGVATINDGAAYGASNLYLGTQTSPTVTGSGLTLTSGSLDVSSWVRTGDGANLNINGGTLNAGNVMIGQMGDQAGESFVNLSSGTINLTGSMAVGRSDDGTLNITGGTISGGNIYYGSGSTTVGTVNHSGGTVTSRIRGSENFATGYGPGIYNLSGTGVLTVNTRLTVGDMAYGEFNMTGGTLTSGGATTQVGAHAGGDGLLNISAGDVNLISGLQLGSVTNGSHGELRIAGTDADITITGNGGIIATANSILNFVIDSAGVSPIVLDVGGNNATYIDGVLDLDLAGGFVPTAGQSFDLILNAANRTGTLSAFPGRTFTDGYDITALTLAAEDAGTWTYEVVPDVGIENYNVLRATYVPEPASLALVALGGVVMLGRRRAAL